ncbi:unnamed protein product [Cuscuta campestris]|uniref:DUF4283 domain-containing protein n=1 Tax=Cuscuta campestris TaxID=132261 RepID=A0A484KB56_9ASTE|nr:unnamed protein product [Cuscuta campestris]
MAKKKGRPKATIESGKALGGNQKSPNNTNVPELKKDSTDSPENSSSNGIDGNPNSEEKGNQEREKQPLDNSPKSYAKAVGKPEPIELDLKFMQFEEVNGTQVAKFTKEDIVEESRYWDSGMILCVLGANPPLDVIKGYIARMWKIYPIDEVYALKEGQFIVQFQKEENRDEVIKRKYYYFDNKPVLVQKWKPGKKVDITELKDIPIWIQFPDLDIKYWSLTGLSKLGSLIGKPIKRDKATATRMKFAYARIQVEVGVYQDFPKTVTYINEEERVITQQVTYEWCPCMCYHCKKIGHEQGNCRLKNTKQTKQDPRRRIWRVKKDENNQKQNEVMEENMDGNKEDDKNLEKEAEATPDQEGFSCPTIVRPMRRDLGSGGMSPPPPPPPPSSHDCLSFLMESASAFA